MLVPELMEGLQQGTLRDYKPRSRLYWLRSLIVVHVRLRARWIMEMCITIMALETIDWCSAFLFVQLSRIHFSLFIRPFLGTLLW